VVSAESEAQKEGAQEVQIKEGTTDSPIHLAEHQTQAVDQAQVPATTTPLASTPEVIPTPELTPTADANLALEKNDVMDLANSYKRES
jgi:hypothetical protein